MSHQKEEYLALIDGADLAGHIVSWEVHGKVAYEKLIEALQASDLETAVAREMLPRNAFARACRQLKEERIIRPLTENETKEEMFFQFTRECLDRDTGAGQYEYKFEAILALNKKTGDVKCEAHPELATLAETHISRCMKERKASDVTTAIVRLFRRNKADFFPINSHGFAYFVPVAHAEFLGRIQKFLERVGGFLHPFPVAAGTKAGKASVKEAVAYGLSKMITDLDEAVEKFSDSTREGTMERYAERIQKAKFKVSAYAEYLEEKKGELLGQLTKANDKLTKKIEELAAQTAAEAPVPAEAVA